MPTGAKKRKAAAKKKQKNYANNTSSASTHSNDDVKHQDDKDSNVGEVSFLASPNHNQQNFLTEGNEETTKNGESVVQAERGFKILDASIEKDGKIEQDELSTSNNSASCSYDEPRGITNNPAVEDYSAAVNPVGATDLLSETQRVDERTLCVEKTEVKSSSDDKVGFSDPNECEVQETEDRFTSYGASNVCVNNGAEGGKNSFTQPLLELPLQTTSWKSCCGLCELFTGSASLLRIKE